MTAGVAHAVGLSFGEPVSGSPDFNNIVANVPVRTLLTGEILFQEGDAKLHLHQILEGVICVYRRRIDRPHEVIEFVFAGDFLGLGELEHQIYWAKALVETRIKCLPLSSLNDVVQDDGRAKKRNDEALRREFIHRRNFLTSANCQEPIGRVAAFFLVVSQLNKNEGRDPNIVTDSLKCGVVADWLGLDLKSLERALVELEKKGLIEPCAPLGLRLKDLPGLETLADKNTGEISMSRVRSNLCAETRELTNDSALQGQLLEVVWIAVIIGGLSAVSVSVGVALALALDSWQLSVVTGHV